MRIVLWLIWLVAAGSTLAAVPSFIFTDAGTGFHIYYCIMICIFILGIVAREGQCFKDGA